MKNISISITPYAVPVVPAPPAPPFANKTEPTPKVNYSINVGVQFDDETEALEYMAWLVAHMQRFKNRNLEDEMSVLFGKDKE